MDFVLNGRTYALDRETVTARVTAAPPDLIQTHWIQIGDRRWPIKQAFRLANNLPSTEPFVSTYALRVLRRLGFETSADAETVVISQAAAAPAAAQMLSGQDAVDAFVRLDTFLSATPLTAALAGLEGELHGVDSTAAAEIAAASGFSEDLVDSALIIRERVGMLDTLIHAAVIIQVLPRILEAGEQLATRPSLGAGNDPGRPFDLETTNRVAEFKLSSWKGQDGARERGLFADVVGLSLDQTGRRRQMYVVGELPVKFLTTSGRNAAKVLSKAALRLRAPGDLTGDMSVAEYTRPANVEVIDLKTLIPKLR